MRSRTVVHNLVPPALRGQPVCIQHEVRAHARPQGVWDFEPPTENSEEPKEEAALQSAKRDPGVLAPPTQHGGCHP